MVSNPVNIHAQNGEIEGKKNHFVAEEGWTEGGWDEVSLFMDWATA